MLPILHVISSINPARETHIITALEKVEDNYDYADISYPTTFDDITPSLKITTN